jgi:hypothetical protein
MAALAVLVAFAIVFDAWSRWITAEPLDAPLTLSPPGRVETEVRVRLACPHKLELEFSSGTRTFEEMRRIVGGYGTTKGVEIPLRWSFRDTTGRVVASGEAENKGIAAHNVKSFIRSASNYLPLPPGKYRLDAVLMDDVAGLQGVSVQLSFRCHYNASAGWPSYLLFFGSIALLLA